MKKRNYTLTTALTAALCCLICLLNGCTRDNDIDIPQTSVNTNRAKTVQKPCTHGSQNKKAMKSFDPQLPR